MVLSNHSISKISNIHLARPSPKCTWYYSELGDSKLLFLYQAKPPPLFNVGKYQT